MSHHRPIGLVCLALVAALFSPLLVLLGVAVFLQVVYLFKDESHKPDYYPLGYVVLMMAGVCVLVAGCIAAITAVDLWKIKKRGRSLAMTAAPILEIFTLWFLVGSAGTIGGYEFWAAISILMLGVITVVYLRLPSIRSRFESQALAERNS